MTETGPPSEGDEPRVIHWQVPPGCEHPDDEACFHCATDDELLAALGFEEQTP